MTLGGGQQKVSMRYFYAKWKKADLIGQKQIKLTALEGPMLSSKSWYR